MAAPKIVLSADLDLSRWTSNVDKYLATITQMVSRTVTGAGQMSGAMSGINDSLSVTIGNLAASAIGKLAQALTEQTRAIVQNVGFFEQLGVTLQFYSASALQARSAGLSIQDALALVGEEAQGTLLFIEQLALASPFTVDQVANAFRTAQAYGLQKEQVQGLLPLLIDFVSINNLGNDVLNRITLAISQISSRGKLAAQEINQLANAGFPLRDILNRELGIATGELDKLLEQGLVPAGPALQAITKYLSQFQGLAEKVALGTLSGLLSSFRDLATIGQKDFFSPVFKELLPVLREIFDTLSQPGTKAILTALGEQFGKFLVGGIRAAMEAVTNFVSLLTHLNETVLQIIFTSGASIAIFTAFAAGLGLVAVAASALLSPTGLLLTAFTALAAALPQAPTIVNRVLIPALQRAGQIIGVTAADFVDFGSIVEDAVGNASDAVLDFLDIVADTGTAIVQFLADGIEASFGLLVPVLQGLGSLIGFFLAPSSPPRILPDLEKWGKETAEIWLKSWTKADFDALDDIAGIVRSGLDLLAERGDLGLAEPARILQRLRPLLAQALDEVNQFGRATERTLQRAAKAAGPLASEVRQMLVAYTNLTAATHAAEAAQERLNRVTDHYNTLLRPIREAAEAARELRTQNDEQIEIASLQRTIANKAVSDVRRQHAQARISEIFADRRLRGLEKEQDAALNAAQAALDAADKKQKAAQTEFDLIQARIKAAQDTIKLAVDEQKALEEIERINKRLAKEAREALFKPLEDALKVFKLQQEELKDLIAAERARFIIASDQFTVADKTREQLELQEIAIRQQIRDLEAAELGFDLSSVRETVIVFDDLNIKLKKGEVAFGDASDAFAGLNQPDTVGLFKEFNEELERARKLLSDTGQQFEDFLDKINRALPPFLRFRTEVQSAAGSLSDQIRTQSAASEQFTALPPLVTNLGAAFAGLAASITASRLVTTLRALPALFTTAGGAMGLLTGGVGLLAAAWIGDWFNIREHAAEALTFVQGKIAEFVDGDLNAFTQQVRTQLDGWIAAFTNITLDIPAKLELLGDTIAAVIQSGFSPALIRFALHAWGTVVGEELGQIAALVDADLPAAFANLFDKIGQLINQRWNPLLFAMAARVDLVVATIGTALGGLARSFVQLLPAVSRLATSLLGLFGPLLTRLTGAATILLNNLTRQIIARLSLTLARAILNMLSLIGQALDVRAFAPQLNSGLLTLIPRLSAFFTNLTLGILQAAEAFTRFAVSTGSVTGILRSVMAFVLRLEQSLAILILRLINIPFALRNAFAAAPALIQRALTAPLGTLTNVFRNIDTAVLNFAKSLQNINKGRLNAVKLAVSIGQVFTRGIPGLFRNLAGGGAGLFKALDFGAIAKSALTFGKTIAGVGKLLRGFLGPLELIISAFDFFAFAFNANIKGVENGARGLVNNLFTFWSDLISGKLFRDIVTNVSPWIERLGRVFADFQVEGFKSDELRTFLGDLGTVVFAWIQEMGTRIFTSLRDFWIPAFGQWIVATIENLGSTIGSILIFLRDWIVAGAVFLYDLLVNHWIPAFTTWWQGGGEEATGNFFQQVIDTITGWIVTSATFLYDNFVANWLPAFVEWIVAVTPIALQKLGEWLGAALGWIIAQVPLILDTLLTWAAAFVEWLGPVVQFTLEHLGVWIGAILKWVIGTGIPLLLTLGAQLIAALVSWIFDDKDSATSGAQTGLTKFLGAVVTFFTQNILPGLASFGLSIVEGIVAGLAELGLKAWNAIRDGFTFAFDKVKEWLGIASPSDWVKENIGVPIMQGLVGGLEELTDNPVFKLVQDVVTGGFNLLKEGAVATFENMTKLVGDIVEGFVKAVVDQLTTFIDDVLNDTGVFRDEMVALFLDMAGQIVDDFVLFAADLGLKTLRLREAVELEFTKLRENVGITMFALRTKVLDEIRGLTTDIAPLLTTFVTTVTELIIGPAETALIPQLQKALVGSSAESKDGLGYILGDLFMQGMARGVTDGAGYIYLAMKQALVDVETKIRADYEITSPSKRMAEQIGKPLAQGIGLGFESLMGDITGRLGYAINSAASRMIRNPYLPTSTTALPQSISNYSRSTTLQLNVSSAVPSQGIIRDFAVMRSMAGA